MPHDFASLAGRRVRIERGTHAYYGIMERPIPIWWIAVDGGGAIMISEDGGWSVTPLDEAPQLAKPASQRRQKPKRRP